MDLTMFSAIIENVEIAGNTKVMKQNQFETNHLQRTQTIDIVYEIKLAIHRDSVTRPILHIAKWTVISTNSGKTSRLPTFYSKLVQSIWYFYFKGSTDTRCGTEKVPLAIKQFSIEYKPDIESNGLIINKKSTVLPVTSELLIDVSLKSNAQLQSNRLFYMIPTQSRFIQDFIIYNGASSSASCDKESFGKSGTIVTQLLKSYLHKDRTLYVDN
ncbi:piggyBac transposable element-derived protein 4-like [Vespula maculifrons]|uniref:PiggyBac transposable element-derived protein 4-like n=1 Tax=Vespula maculifrons TaxID=7453 RepID=A0ABD2CKR3_VESMC